MYIIFDIVIIYSAVMLNSLTSSSNYFIDSIWFLNIDGYYVCKQGQFTSFFPIWIFLLIFLGDYTVSGESGHSCLISDLKVKAFSLSP